MTPLLFAAIFFLLITPIGLIRRLMGYDPMQVKPANKSRVSAFSERNHEFTPLDLEKPFLISLFKETSMDFILEFWEFLKQRKKFWLLPIIMVLLFFGMLIVLTSGSAVAPFIYALF
ncbi:MAG: hypothetical protein HGA96_04530 [Desulfobulbaceae bacterium]|nr:hypothetical protein [Desulfobulbaceae bacterium]